MTQSGRKKIRRALISVSKKNGVVELAEFLTQLNIDIISTGGTAQLLKENNIPVIEVSDYTGHPEMMSGRIKTLHPKIHGGILARREKDLEELKTMGVGTIDLVVVNLYPFPEVVRNPKSTPSEIIENIDIGGPTMLRAAAKNHADVTVVTHNDDYKTVINELKNYGGISASTRLRLAEIAFSHTAHYDDAISNYLAPSGASAYPKTLNLQFHKNSDMRYGENPHQKAAFYEETNPPPGTIASAKHIQGKPLSFNNIVDADAGLECVHSFEDIACVIIKHGNPCGVAIGKNTEAAYKLAYKTDPTSAFGGIIAFNRALDGFTAKTIIDNQFVEVVVSPEINQDAIKVFSAKPSVRLIESGYPTSETFSQAHYKRVSGGLLIQEYDYLISQEDQFEVVSKKTPNDEELLDLLFSWKVAKYVKSNAIILAKRQTTVGIGAGQMSRVDSARIAVTKAKEQSLQISGCSMASDAFFPFPDAIETAAKFGISSVIQPGGSVHDNEIIESVNKNKMSMIFTGMRHFRH